MPEEKQEFVDIRFVHKAEESANVYREALLVMSLENDQLYNDYCALYDKMVQISARIDMANSCLSSPEIALVEIGDIIEAECQS